MSGASGAGGANSADGATDNNASNNAYNEAVTALARAKVRLAQAQADDDRNEDLIAVLERKVAEKQAGFAAAGRLNAARAAARGSGAAPPRGLSGR